MIPFVAILATKELIAIFTVFLRAGLLYIIVIFSLRLMGKRQLGELQPTELVITILISNIAALPIENPSLPMTMGAIPIMVLVGFELLISNISLRSRGFRQFVSGRPIVVISHGVVLQKALHEVRFSIDDLLESLRAQGVFDLQKVQYAVVETTGNVSVLQTSTEQPYTAGMAGKALLDNNPPVVLISDGKIQTACLDYCALDTVWLNRVLLQEGCLLSQVFLLTVDGKRQYQIIKKEG